MPNRRMPLPSQATQITPHMERYNARKSFENAVRNPTPQLINKTNQNYIDIAEKNGINFAKALADKKFDDASSCQPTIGCMWRTNAFTIKSDDIDTLVDEKKVFKAFMVSFTKTHNELMKDYEGSVKITFKTRVKIGNDFVKVDFDEMEPVVVGRTWIKIMKMFIKVNYFCGEDHEHIGECTCDSDNNSDNDNNDNNSDSDSDDPSI